MNIRRPIAYIISGALFVNGVWICEGVENPHVEQYQHEEIPNLTYDVAQSTPTVTRGIMLMPDDFNSPNRRK